MGNLQPIACLGIARPRGLRQGGRGRAGVGAGRAAAFLVVSHMASLSAPPQQVLRFIAQSLRLRVVKLRAARIARTPTRAAIAQGYPPEMTRRYDDRPL
ncbi:hypothetical protein DDE20_13790 [Pararhodobacter oceanensis]|uniref:Uncharacterized protein n=1 Tax=Pararhodobacter oceanensis TaxID=2172121 RepID=A0A2T8HRX1_9RHOB|nr:hypothetical protein DDE20_13790 [Pararhodobacter oceanensis]